MLRKLANLSEDAKTGISVAILFAIVIPFLWAVYLQFHPHPFDESWGGERGPNSACLFVPLAIASLVYSCIVRYNVIHLLVSWISDSARVATRACAPKANNEKGFDRVKAVCFVLLIVGVYLLGYCQAKNLF